MTSKKSLKAILKVEIRDSFYYTFATAVTQLGNFLVIPLFWKVLTPADYGIIAITEIIGRFLTILLGLSLDQSITRFYYQWPENERKRRIGAIWTINWLSAIILGILSIVVIRIFSPFLFPQVPFYPLIFIGCLNTITTSLTVIAQTTIRIKKLPRLYACYQIFTFFTQIGLTSYQVLILKKGLFGYFSSLLIASFVVAIISGLIMWRFSTICLHDAGIKDALKFSVPMIPSALIAALTSILDRFLLNQFCSLQTLGIYSIAMKFASIVTVLQTSIKLSYGPFFMKNIFKENGQEVIKKMMAFYIYPLFLAGMTLSLFTDKVIYFINQPEYFPVIHFVPYLVVITVIGSLNVFYANGIILSNKTHLLMYPAVIQLLTLLSGYYLIPRFQIYGVIIGKLISASCFFLSSIFLSNKVYYISYNWNKLVTFSVMLFAGVSVYLWVSEVDITHNALISSTIFFIFLVCSYISLRSEMKTSTEITVEAKNVA